MPITFLDEEEDITPLAPPTKRKITFLDEEDDIAPVTPQATQPAVTQPSPYKYDPARFRPRGLTAPKAEEKPEEQGILRQVADIPLGIARGGVTGIKMMTDILGADNAVSKSLAGVEGYMADLMSAQAKEDQQEISRIMKDAEDKGFGEQVKAGIKAFSIAPVDIMSQALGTMAPVLATGLAGSAAKIGALGIRGIQAGVGAGMGAGMIKGEIYNEVKNELVNSGIAEDAAEKAAVDAQSYGGKNLDQILLGAGLGAASTLGAEGIITRILTKQGTAPAAGVVSRVLKGGLTEAAPEAAQAAQEQLAKNVALQREGFDVDPSRGVVAAATMEAVAAAPLGGIAGAVEKPAPIKTLAEENLEQTNEIARKVAENGAPLTASAIQDQAATNLRQDELAKQLEAQLEEELVAVKKPTAAAQKPMSKDEFKAIYSQVAPEELDAAEAGFTEQAATDATEEGRISAQNALEAIKEVKATVTPPEPPVEPAITPAVTPAVPTAQPPITDATQEIIQPEGVRQEPQDGTQVQPTPQAGVGGGVFDTARGQEEGQVVPTTQPTISEIPPTSELVGAEPTQPTIREVPEISPIVGAEPAAIVEQEPVAPAEPAQLPIEEPPVKISRGENFSMYGEYNVSIGDKKHRIYRDPERGYWYDADVQEEAVRSGSPKQGSPSLGLLSTETRKDAIAELVNKYKEEQQAAIPLEAPTPVTTPPVTEAVTPAEAPAITPPTVAETPAVTEAPAAEVAPVQRDITKPEQMTPEERGTQGHKLVIEQARQDFELAKTGQTFGFSGGQTYKSKAAAIKDTKSTFEQVSQPTEADIKRGASDHYGEINRAISDSNPVSAAAVDTYDITLPEGYTKQGDLYVYQPAVSETITPAAEPEGKAVTPAQEDVKVSRYRKFLGESAPQAISEAKNALSTFKTTMLGKRGDSPFQAEPRLRELKNVISLFVANRLNVTNQNADQIAEQIILGKPNIVDKVTELKPIKAKELDDIGANRSAIMRFGYELDDKKTYRHPREAEVIAATPAAEPAGISVGNRIKLGKSPQTYTIEEVIPQSATERELGEQYYSVKNERTGETQVVEARDLKQVKGKGARKIAADQYPTIGININDKTQNFTDQILSGEKTIETRDTDSLRRYVGQRIGIVRTGKGKATLVGYADIGEPIVYNNANEFRADQDKHLVEERSKFDIKSGEKKYGYPLTNIQSIDPIEIPPNLSNWYSARFIPQPTSPDIRRQAIDTTPEGILTTPPDQQYTFNEVFDVAYDMFGGEIPEGFTIVNDSTDKDFEFKAAYIPESGEIIVNLAYLNKSDDIRDTITHELGHYIFGDPEFRAAFDQFIASLSPEARAELDAYVETAYNKETGEIRLEEKMVRAFVDQFLNEEQAPAWRSMLDAIKRFLNKLGFKFNISDRDAISVFTAALDRYKAGEAISREGGARLMAAEPAEVTPADEARREQVAGMKIGRIITTPPDIKQKTTDIIRSKFFDSTKVSPESTSQAWAYISQFMDKADNSNNKFAGYVNNVTELELPEADKRGIDESIGAVMLQVELANYAGRLATQGDTKMLSYIIRNGNRMPTGEYSQGVRKAGKDLNAVKDRLKDQAAGFAAFNAELKSNVERLASTLFGTNNPNEDQIAIAQQALTDADNIELGDANQVADDIKEVETRTNKGILQKIDDLISGYDNPKKDQLLLIFANLIRSRDVDGITISYKPAKFSISDRIANLIVKNLANYRDTLVDKAASGLESTFWRTMSSQENKPGLLGELDQAQNNELAKIVKATLIKMKLAGEPKNTKMTDIEKVASILNESKLSEEKRIEADKRIVEEIDRRRQEELSTTENQDAVNAKYDSILKAWNDSMSRQLNMPVSDSMLQRLISSEMKEQDIKIRDLVDEADGKVVAEKKQNIINSIIRKIYGVSKESETGIEMDENYDGLKSYLEQTLENMYALSVEEKNAAYAKRQAKISLRNTAESQAQSIINRLADQLSDTPAFPEKQENEVKAIVQQDLKQIPDMNRKQPWTSQLTAKLMRAGVSETQAQIISDLVWRQHEIKTMDRESKELQTAAEEGSLAVIIDRIKNTPLEKQQSPEWKQEVIKEYLREAGLSNKAAETAAKLYDSVISERLAAAKQKAFEATLAKAAPWKDYASRNSKLAKDALRKVQDAIRTGVLDPDQTTESIIAAQNGWTGFTKEQYQRIVEIDTILNDPNQDDVTKKEALAELNKIITEAKLPAKFKEAIADYYVGQALLGIPTFSVNMVSPAGFSIRNLVTDISRYAFTDPKRIPIAFESFLDSMRSWYGNVSYSFRTEIYPNDVVEYLQGGDALKEIFNRGKKQWAEGKYAEGFTNMAVGMAHITKKVLSALDQGAISMIENQNLTRYAMEALSAQKKIPKDQIRAFGQSILAIRNQSIAQSVSEGMPRDRAIVLADLAAKSELIYSLSRYEISPDEVLSSAINDALQSVGRNRKITINGIEQSDKDISDTGTLTYFPIRFLEMIAEKSMQSGPAMQVFSKMVYGFALIPARVFSNVAWFSPVGAYRFAVNAFAKSQGWKSPYAMSLGTGLQYRQRLTETIAGSIAMLGLVALRSDSTEDDEDKKFKIVITGNGPNAVTDKQYYDSWIKKWKPYSIHIVVDGKIIPINIGRGGEALFFPIMLAGALDDLAIKKKQNLTKKEPEDLVSAVEVLGSSFFALAQRGPYAAFTKPLFDASKQGRVTEELASQAGYFGKTFIPVLGTSLARNITDFINDPVDRSSIEGAIYANTPVVGPWLGTKALNALGQPIRADDWGDKLFKLGVPVVFSFPKNTPENALNEIILKQGSGPTIPTRSNAQKRFGDVLTDKEFEAYVREYGRVMSDKMFKSRTKLANMKPADYDDELEKYARGYSIDGIKIKGASDSAVLAVKRMRQ